MFKKKEKTNEPIPALENVATVEAEKTSPPDIGIIRIPLPSESATPGIIADSVAETISPDDLRRRAKMLAPGIEQLVKLCDRTTVKVLKRQLMSAGVTKDRAQEISECAGLSKDSIETVRESGSRILARRVKNEEAADYMALGGVAFEWLGGLTDVLSEIRLLRKAIEDKNANSH